jgi:hypothetical protein
LAEAEGALGTGAEAEGRARQVAGLAAAGAVAGPGAAASCSGAAGGWGPPQLAAAGCTGCQSR